VFIWTEASLEELVHIITSKESWHGIQLARCIVW